MLFSSRHAPLGTASAGRAAIPGIPLWRTMVCLILVVAVASPAFAQRKRKPVETPVGPQLYQSANFHVVTDLSPESAEELLTRLETMLKLVSRYWGRPNARPIEMFVVDDLNKWPADSLAQMAPDGLSSIQSGGGLTITQVISSGNQFISKSVVYAVSDRGTPQHEAVHAYCGHAFGTAGPVWYAEGMAEVGQCWRENDKSVTTDPYVIDYLKSATLRPLNDIVNNPLETTGDSWQNYAWRWALCHLLGFNENYTQRFKPLGLALLARKQIDFWEVYGTQSQEIEFEYQQFLRDLAPGYRCDLCSWDWKTKFRRASGASRTVAKVQAARGWQASRLTLDAGEEYEYLCSGDWSLEPDGEELTADGGEGGRGKLVGVLFKDYELDAPFELGTSGTFVAPSDGDLFLRCQDDWGKIAGHSGTVTLKIKLKGNGPALK